MVLKKPSARRKTLNLITFFTNNTYNVTYPKNNLPDDITTDVKEDTIVRIFNYLDKKMEVEHEPIIGKYFLSSCDIINVINIIIL